MRREIVCECVKRGKNEVINQMIFFPWCCNMKGEKFFPRVIISSTKFWIIRGLRWMNEWINKYLIMNHSRPVWSFSRLHFFLSNTTITTPPLTPFFLVHRRIIVVTTYCCNSFYVRLLFSYLYVPTSSHSICPDCDGCMHLYIVYIIYTHKCMYVRIHDTQIHTLH